MTGTPRRVFPVKQSSALCFIGSPGNRKVAGDKADRRLFRHESHFCQSVGIACEFCFWWVKTGREKRVACKSPDKQDAFDSAETGIALECRARAKGESMRRASLIGGGARGVAR